MEKREYKKRTLITWFNVQDLCRFPTKGKEQRKRMNVFKSFQDLFLEIFRFIYHKVPPAPLYKNSSMLKPSHGVVINFTSKLF